MNEHATAATQTGPELTTRSIVGIGMLINASVLITFILGGMAQLIWAKTSPKSEEDFRVPLASGLIVGEAILAVVLALLAAFGFNF
jgi:uncharacterized oligopeptide transporter (OPT) family protein